MKHVFALVKFATIIAVLWSSQAVAQAGRLVDFDQMRSIISSKTMMSYDRGHGTQVEFMAPNGKTYLFYPGNTSIVPGEWKLVRTKQPYVFDICFRYPSSSYNPMTRTTGGAWNCRVSSHYVAGMAEIMPGDVLRLTRQKAVPFVLARGKTSLTALIRKVPLQ